MMKVEMKSDKLETKIVKALQILELNLRIKPTSEKPPLNIPDNSSLKLPFLWPDCVISGWLIVCLQH